MPTRVGNVALFCAESPEVWFSDILRVPMQSKVTAVPLDSRFVEVCEPGSIVIQVVTPEHNLPWRAALIHTTEGAVILDLWAESPVLMVVTVAGIRKGFKDIRFPYRTERRRVLNNERWSYMSGAEIEP